MNITTIMRVKNEEPYIRHALESVREVGPVIVLDDHSTDATPDICAEFDNVTVISQTARTMDEGRDRTRLAREAMESGADWVFTLDGDEVLDTPERLVAACEQCDDSVSIFRVFMAVMKTPPGADRQKWLGPMVPLGLWKQPRAFRTRDADRKSVLESGYKHNLHCGCVPRCAGEEETLNCFIRYYGYDTPEAVERKRSFYAKYDLAHIKQAERIWRKRAEVRPVPWTPNPDARLWGLGGTVTYNGGEG